MVQACNRCGTELEILRRCKACSRAWYCSEQCQKTDWVRHIIDCNPKRPITTADHLVRAVDLDYPPDDDETRADYGFDKVLGPGEVDLLFGLYRGFVNGVGDSMVAKKMHRWRVNGTLVEEIHKVYGRFPEHDREPYYAWFLQNQHVLSAEPLDKREIAEAMLSTWRFIRRSPTASYQDMVYTVRNMSRDKQICAMFYHFTLHDGRPPLVAPHHINMGFVGAHCEDDEQGLSVHYLRLIIQCSFDDFCAAYTSHTIPSLFAKHGSVIDDPLVLDLLNGPPGIHKSVWDLKVYVIQPTSANAELLPFVFADYGFMNCKNAAEKEDLKQVYKQVFLRPAADPLALHQAAMNGKIYEHVHQLVALKPKRYFARLMENIYPPH